MTADRRSASRLFSSSFRSCPRTLSARTVVERLHNGRGLVGLLDGLLLSRVCVGPVRQQEKQDERDRGAVGTHPAPPVRSRCRTIAGARRPVNLRASVPPAPAAAPPTGRRHLGDSSVPIQSRASGSWPQVSSR